LPEAPPVFRAVDTADVLGWLYVSQGSTLGGAVLDRTLGKRFSARTFTPYVEGPGPMWRDYRALLAEWVGADEARCHRVVTAAVATFAALEQWIAPLGREEAA
jgi:heme oxygenase